MSAHADATLSPVILSVADGERYERQLDRLARSLEAIAFNGAHRFWRAGSLPPHSPSHAESPFAFKPFAFEAVRREGGGVAVWLDASCVAVRPLDQIQSAVEERGYVLFANGQHKVGEWASDDALADLGVTRDEAMDIPEVMAAALALDVRHPAAAAFLDAWRDAARRGVAFRGSREPVSSKRDYVAMKWNHGGRASHDPRVRGHRHDQTVAGVLAHRLGMSLTQAWFESGPTPTRSDTILLIDRDGGRPAPARALGAFVRRHPRLAAAVRQARRGWLFLRS